MATSSKRAYAIPKSAAPRAPASAAVHCWPISPQEPNTVLSQSLWSLWVLVFTRFVWALWVSLVGMGFDSKCNFTPSSILLGLLLCPWMWGIFSKSLQRHTAAAVAPTIFLGLLCLCTWGIYSHSLQCHAAATPAPAVNIVKINYIKLLNYIHEL